MIIIPVVCIIVSFFFYLLTLCPTIFVGDSPELISAAYTLGIAHPPGYPLFCIIGKIFTILLPFSNVAYRVNLMSATLASLTVFVLYLLIFRLIDSQFQTPHPKLKTYAIAFTSSLCFAFSYTFWTQAVISEVYVLNTFLMALILLIFTRGLYPDNNFNIKLIFLSFFLWGVSLANHHIAVFLFPVFLSYIWQLYKKKQFSKVLFLALFFLIGILIYIYLPLRAFSSPLSNWGDPVTVKDIIRHIGRLQYGSVTSPRVRTLLLFLNQLSSYFNVLLKQFTPFLLIFTAFGFYYIFKLNKKLWGVLLLVFLMTGIGWVWILNFQISTEETYLNEVFYIPSFLIAAIYIGAGVKFIFDVLSKKLSYSRIIYPLSILLVIVICLPLGFNFKSCNFSNNYITYAYGIDILNSVEKDGILFLAGDNETFPVAYLSKVELKRSDIEIYDDIGAVFSGVYGRELLKLPTEEAVLKRDEAQSKFIEESKRPLYCTIGSNVYNKPGKFTIPVGMVYQLSKTKFTDFKHTDKFWPSSFFSRIGLRNENDFYVKSLLAKYYYSLGEFYSLHGNKDDALKEYMKANEVGYDMPWIQNNLAIAYSHGGLNDKALESSKRAAEINPENPTVHKNLAYLYMGKNMLDEAIKEAKTAIKFQPNLAQAYEVLTEAYEKKGQYDETIEYGKRALKLDPFLHKVYFNLGNAYLKKGMIDEAVRQFEATIGAGSREPEAHNNLAGIYIGRGMYDKAIYECKRALILYPDYTDAYNNLGIAYVSKKMFKEAITAFKKSSELNPKDVDILFNLGLCYKDNGEIEEAKKIFKRILAIDPSHKGARAFLSKL